MDSLLIKKIGLSTITISLNLLLPIKVLALPEVSHQNYQYIDSFSEEFSHQYIFSNVLRKSNKAFDPGEHPDNQGKPDDAKEGSGTR